MRKKYNYNLIPRGFKPVRTHMVFDIKYDGRFKCRLVADGNMTDVPVDSVYSGVVSLRGFRMCLFVAELNGLQSYATDITSAYLESYTTERLYVKAGNEFGDLAGHHLIVSKALYGLRSSGLRFNELLGRCLTKLGFKRSKCEDDIWIREADEHYDLVATYVDDLLIVGKDVMKLLSQLQAEPFNFKLKGTAKIENTVHLGCGFTRDSDGQLCMNPDQYIKRMEDSYNQRFPGEKLNRKISSPLEPGDHPELDTSEFLDQDGTEIYQSLIGAFQWAITIGRWDIQTAVMTMSSFRAQPRVGHLLRVKRIYNYIINRRHYLIRFNVKEPNYNDVPENRSDWSNTPYGNEKEDLPTDVPKPKGNGVVLSH